MVLSGAVAIALGVLTCRYLACCRRQTPGGEEHGVGNGFTVRFDDPQTINGSPRIDKANGSEGNSVANGNVKSIPN